MDSSGEQQLAHVTAQFHGVSAVLAAFPGCLAWLLCCISLSCYVTPIQKPGRHWKSLPVSPDQFWKAFYTTFTNKDKIMAEMRVVKCYTMLCERFTLQQLGHPMLCVEEVPFWLCFQKHHLGLESQRVCWSLTLGMALPAQSGGLAAHEEIILLFSRIRSEAALEPLCCNAILSTIHAGNGNSKCSTLTLWSTPPKPPLPCCFIPVLSIPSHIIKCAYLSPGSPIISLWLSSLMCK